MITSNGKIEAKECIGLVVDIKDSNKFQESMKSIIAEKHIDICVIIDGIRKDFNMNEFKKKLGF